MSKPSGDEIATHYLASYERIARLVRSLSDSEVQTAVPATPGWTVHDVVAHLAAITTDALGGRLTGMPSDEDTAQQVAVRRGRSTADVLDEWAGNVHQMADGARAGLVPPNLAVDAVTHEQDIRGALGVERVPDVTAIAFSLDLYAFGLGRFRLADRAPLALVSTDTGTERLAGKGEPAATVRAPEFELFRAVSGRRSRAQVERYAWSGDATYADDVSVFGALPAGDLTD